LKCCGYDPKVKLNASKFFGGLLTGMIQAKPEVKIVTIPEIRE